MVVRSFLLKILQRLQYLRNILYLIQNDERITRSNIHRSHGTETTQNSFHIKVLRKKLPGKIVLTTYDISLFLIFKPGKLME